MALATLLLFAPGSRGQTAPEQSDDRWQPMREAMVTRQIEARGIRDPAVLAALRRVPRHRFVPEARQDEAYRDHPLPIGHGQTISQPYIVALMTELVEPRPEMKVLEVGTGSGYQAAVLAECVGHVFTIEILPELSRRSSALLAKLGYDNVHTRIGDGYDGWPDEAPFDAIVVTAAPPEIPQPLLEQLAVGGRLVIPVGRGTQDLVVVTRSERGFSRRVVTPVRFVPMTGKADER
ncbi:MAG: protein-L-isoaspartate(D-aspartate) O-methyltransferase [Gammaproteobacteria bacterium]|nr:protein-L-isoaspartate(D-aspartate) O-methyltransferase [Gammaproteobacteria bacterium]